MGSARILFKALLLALPLFLCGGALAFVVDDDVPDITGRVARISFVDGDVQVRRSGAQDWEKAVLNLPVVEGDEIAALDGSRVEIQFDVRTFVRMDSRSMIRITTFKDEGFALSVPEGTVNIRVTDFDKDRSFLEIDIPNSTLAVQRAGLYRIDAGAKDSAEARVRVTDGGEARVYSDTSGFTLKNGRAATIYLSGVNAGEWDTIDASIFTDGFDRWALDRDAVVAKRIKDAFFDKYYDRDIYGAEDLSDYGEWVYTRSYGYVWRPYRNSIASYSDWSPYRYGHWRWVPPYGWTWVNDEPWGWATYHYGRWVWDNGYWYWTPYGYYRYRRSWWQPALVVINIFNNNVCWYPLPYHYRYRNYSHRNWNNGNWGDRNNGGGNNGPRPTMTPTPNAGPTSAQIIEERRQRMHTPPLSSVPPTGVVTVGLDEFGKGKGGLRRPTLAVARTVLSKDPDEMQGTPILLPTVEQVKPRISKEIIAEGPPIIATESRTVKTGAAERTASKPLDEDLRKTRIFGNRPPLVVENPPVTPTKTETQTPTLPTETRQETRRTGAVDRPPLKPREETPENQSPPFNPSTRTEERRYEPSSREEPKYEAPKVEEPRNQTPRRIETPRYEPPPQRSEPKYEPPPRREEPRSEPPKRQEPAPQKSEPPKQDKPSPPLKTGGGKKDGR